MSGRDIKDEQPSKMLHNNLILLVFHPDISGKDFNDEQFLNI